MRLIPTAKLREWAIKRDKLRQRLMAEGKLPEPTLAQWAEIDAKKNRGFTPEGLFGLSAYVPQEDRSTFAEHFAAIGL